jgi:hypothetical protein
VNLKDLIIYHLLILVSPYFKLEFEIELVLFSSLNFDRSVPNIIVWMIFCYLLLILLFLEFRILNGVASRCSKYIVSLHS